MSCDFLTLHFLCSNALQNSASTSGSRPAQEEEEKLGEAMHIRRLLHDNTEEMRSILRALNGEYIEPQAGGDLLRDGAGVLPTGGSNGSSPLQNNTSRFSIQTLCTHCCKQNIAT